MRNPNTEHWNAGVTERLINKFVALYSLRQVMRRVIKLYRGPDPIIPHIAQHEVDMPGPNLAAKV